MKCDAEVSPAFVPLTRYAPYNSSIASSASTSTASVWSDTASQSSDDSSASTTSSDSDSCDSYCSSRRSNSSETLINFRRNIFQQQQQQQQQTTTTIVPPELRQNPRRTAPGGHTRTGCPPALVRQCDRKVNFVDSLVDSSTQIVEAIWPLSSAPCRPELGSKAILPLRTFIQETLRRSRTSYSTLQVALYYLVLIKPHVPKRNFTMEQLEDRYADRALQCGRRMFLAALILASKYLQDRNYSARAWSKISGLNTQEINQNEIAFLIAVNWKLHITDEVFQRWTEIVLKYTPPPSPPSPDNAAMVVAQQTLEWKRIILKLRPDLTNIEALIPTPQKTSDLCALSPRSILNLPQEPRSVPSRESAERTPTIKSYGPPAVVIEPTPSTSYMPTPGRLAPPSLGLLPTPRLTPQSSGFCTPAVSAASHLLGKSNAMGMAMAQANTVNSVQHLDRFPISLTSSPQGYCPARRSSLANSISTASSPESMVSDLSQTSRSSSISSASSLASASLSSKLMAPRFRVAKFLNERSSLKATIPSVPEDYDERCFTSSPESYTGPVTKLGDMVLDTPLARRECELEEMSRDSADAARALQELHNHPRYAGDSTPTPAKTGIKRSRTLSVDNSLQDNVREMLHAPYETLNSSWPESLVNSRGNGSDAYVSVPVRASIRGTRKRQCCSAEAASGYQAAASLPGTGFRGPGMWEGILN
ncbi:G1/S-specific cyclin pas1 [Cladobotryum mycophilum]|uniref:G1/S-specific cyclin pas1 n=1 Tax=Cladobotryum mycophilum TaxID=491253 RepID=A0ABR0T3H7_9HYPO